MAAGALVLLTILFSVKFSAGKKNEDFPDGLHFVCNKCNHFFVLSAKKLFQIYSEQKNASAFPCPNCHERTAVRSVNCYECGEPFAVRPFMDRGSKCLACQSKLEKPTNKRLAE